MSQHKTSRFLQVFFQIAVPVLLSAALLGFDFPRLWPNAIDALWIELIKIIVVVFVGLIATIAAVRIRFPDLGVSGMVLAYLSAGLFGYYQVLIRDHTCLVSNQRYVIGQSPLLERDCAAEIKSVFGYTNYIWEYRELQIRYAEIILTYSIAVLAAAFVSFAIMSWLNRGIQDRLLRLYSERTEGRS